MKPESLKHLQNLYERTEDKYFKETIEAIIRLESEAKSKGKFSLWDYVSKDDFRPYTHCVLHDSGYKVASDGRILVVLKEDYLEDMEGKLMRKDGTIEDDNVKFPKNWRTVIPDPKKTEMLAVRLDFARIRQFEADFKAKKKLDKRMDGYVRVGGCLFKLDYLIKAVRFMDYVGTDELMVSPDGKRAALAVSGYSKMILLPICPREKFEENEVCYGL